MSLEAKKQVHGELVAFRGSFVESFCTRTATTEDDAIVLDATYLIIEWLIDAIWKI